MRAAEAVGIDVIVDEMIGEVVAQRTQQLRSLRDDLATLRAVAVLRQREDKFDALRAAIGPAR
jgi:hypothetical protein